MAGSGPKWDPSKMFDLSAEEIALINQRKEISKQRKLECKRLTRNPASQGKGGIIVSSIHTKSCFKILDIYMSKRVFYVLGYCILAVWHIFFCSKSQRYHNLLQWTLIHGHFYIYLFSHMSLLGIEQTSHDMQRLLQLVNL